MSLKLDPWFAWTPEERAYVVYQAYNRRILDGSEVKDYLNAARLYQIGNIVFPLALFGLLNTPLLSGFNSSFLRRHQPNVLRVLQLGLTGIAWLFWINHGPLYRKMTQLREEKLKTVEGKIGRNLRFLNDVLPRWWGEVEINRKLRKLYNNRNGLLAGYLYAYEDSAEPLVDASSWPRQKKSEKITK
jgi:hypothetical protein